MKYWHRLDGAVHLQVTPSLPNRNNELHSESFFCDNFFEGRQSATKQKVYLPLFDQGQCIEQYQQIGIAVDEKQLCAGGVEKQDTCDGDSGNALMKIVSNSWIIEGIVSYGRSCGVAELPAVYTRVSAFEQWIRSNMRP